MNIKELYIKLFLKQKAVIIKRVDESGRMTSHWTIPSIGNTLKLNKSADAVVLDKSCRLLSTKHNIPTYVFHYNDCQPIKLDDISRIGIHSMEELRLILDNTEAHKMFQAGNKSSVSQEAKIIIIVILLGFVGLGYFLNTKFAPLYPDPAPIPIVEVIDNGTE